jgi:hypothetical protein
MGKGASPQGEAYKLTEAFLKTEAGLGPCGGDVREKMVEALQKELKGRSPPEDPGNAKGMIARLLATLRNKMGIGVICPQMTNKKKKAKDSR